MNRLHLCSPLNRTLTVSSLPKSSSSIDASMNCVVLSSKCLISINLCGVVQTQCFGAYLLVKKGSSKFTSQVQVLEVVEVLKIKPHSVDYVAAQLLLDEGDDS
jgi:hypothetical protein